MSDDGHDVAGADAWPQSKKEKRKEQKNRSQKTIRTRIRAEKARAKVPLPLPKEEPLTRDEEGSTYLKGSTYGADFGLTPAVCCHDGGRPTPACVHGRQLLWPIFLREGPCSQGASYRLSAP
jgi:hypothetical protein